MLNVSFPAVHGKGKANRRIATGNQTAMALFKPLQTGINDAADAKTLSAGKSRCSSNARPRSVGFFQTRRFALGWAGITKLTGFPSCLTVDWQPPLTHNLHLCWSRRTSADDGAMHRKPRKAPGRRLSVHPPLPAEADIGNVCTSSHNQPTIIRQQPRFSQVTIR